MEAPARHVLQQHIDPEEVIHRPPKTYFSYAEACAPYGRRPSPFRALEHLYCQSCAQVGEAAVIGPMISLIMALTRSGA